MRSFFTTSVFFCDKRLFFCHSEHSRFFPLHSRFISHTHVLLLHSRFICHNTFLPHACHNVFPPYFGYACHIRSFAPRMPQRIFTTFLLPCPPHSFLRLLPVFNSVQDFPCYTRCLTHYVSVPHSALPHLIVCIPWPTCILFRRPAS